MASNLNERLKSGESNFSVENGGKPKGPLQRDLFGGTINNTFLAGTYKNTLSAIGKLIAFGRIK